MTILIINDNAAARTAIQYTIERANGLNCLTNDGFLLLSQMYKLQKIREMKNFCASE